MCDEKSATGDHIPPKGLFTTSIRNDCKFLIVPACKMHNEGSKLDDEYFRTVMAVGSPKADAALKLIDERIMPSDSSMSVIKSLDRIAQPVQIKNPDGTVEDGYKFEIDKQRFQKIVDKIAKGLYWATNGKRLPEDYEVAPYLWNPAFAEEQKRIIGTLPILFVGHPKVFEFRYGEVGEQNKVVIGMSFFDTSNLLFCTIGPISKHGSSAR